MAQAVFVRERTGPRKELPIGFYMLGQRRGSSNSSDPQSAQLSPGELPEVYLESITRKQLELSEIEQDVPPSRSPSPVQDEASNNRVEVLKTRVKKAFEYANGDPADGKWSAVVQLLHLRSSMGGARWIGSSTEAKITESRTEWANAEMEQERLASEQQRNELERSRKKVESWKEKLDSQETLEDDQQQLPTPSTSLPGLAEKAKSTPAAKSGGLKNTKLSFPVVKRSSFVTTGKPKPTSPTSPPSVPTDSRSGQPPKQPSDPSPEQTHRVIEDISESSFLPPSFPSHLATSTPNQAEQKKRKPEAIPAIADPIGPIVEKELPSPPIASTSMGGPSFITPSKPRGPVPSSPQKRARSATPGNPGKRPRSGDVAEEQEEDDTVRSALPLETPTHRTLPTLTELLASSRRSQKGKGKAKANTPSTADDDIFSKPLEASPMFPPLDGLPQSTQQDHSAVFSKPLEASSMFPPLDGLPQSTQQDHSAVFPLFDGAASPAKSLSSLAASDSEDEDEENHGGIAFNDSDEFNPPFASTQPEDVALAKGGINNSSGLFPFNSQLNVNERVDEVVKFMDDDIDYEKWMKYPEADEDD